MADSKKQRKQVSRRVLKGRMFDILEEWKFPQFIKGNVITEELQRRYPDLSDLTQRGLATVAGLLLSHPDELGYGQYARGRNGYTYSRQKVISRVEFNPQLVSVYLRSPIHQASTVSTAEHQRSSCSSVHEGGGGNLP